MAGQVEICNRALIKLGAARITALSDSKSSAYVLADLWDTCRRSELSKRFWGFSLKRTQLAALSAAPSWGFGSQYQLPGDFIRLVQCGDVYAVPAMMNYRDGDDSPYAIEGQALLTDFQSPLKIRYVSDVTDPGLFNPLFCEGLACKLAYEACMRITESLSKRDDLEREYKQTIQDAARANAIERPPQGIPDDSWVLARL